MIRRLALILLPLMIALVLPVWTVWYVGAWEANGKLGTSWQALMMLPANLRAAGTGYVLMLQTGNLTQSAVLLGIGLLTDSLRASRRRRFRNRAARGFAPIIGQ